MCNRVSFMYGMPYNETNLVPELHGAEQDGERPELPEQFGGIPIHMYLHGAQNVRRGWAGGYPPEVSANGYADDRDTVGPKSLKRFKKLDQITLITGALNRIWHRESIDLMYHWLQQAPPNHWRKFRKVILRDYGHQDMLWGPDAAHDVFPEIQEGLEGP
tara:strand:+ start:62 stop:541 length:480 start_codon:yes stop_codon:yes gene_type:complete